MKATFRSDLVLVAATDNDDGQWILGAPLVYDSVIAGRTLTVPMGFRTDLASTPRLPVVYLLFGGVATRAAVVHDYLYSTGEVPRKLADEVMREASEVIGVPWWRRWAMWAGVRVGGASRYSSAGVAA